jgi:hypothetical protein
VFEPARSRRGAGAATWMFRFVAGATEGCAFRSAVRSGDRPRETSVRRAVRPAGRGAAGRTGMGEVAGAAGGGATGSTGVGAGAAGGAGCGGGALLVVAGGATGFASGLGVGTGSGAGPPAAPAAGVPRPSEQTSATSTSRNAGKREPVNVTRGGGSRSNLVPRLGNGGARATPVHGPSLALRGSFSRRMRIVWRTRLQNLTPGRLLDAPGRIRTSDPRIRSPLLFH